jgi:hypothetical protein
MTKTQTTNICHEQPQNRIYEWSTIFLCSDMLLFILVGVYCSSSVAIDTVFIVIGSLLKRHPRGARSCQISGKMS